MIYFLICTWPFNQIIGPSFIYFFFSAQPFDQKLGSSLIYIFHLHTTIQQKYMTFLSFILSLCTTIQPKISILINCFFYFYMTIWPKLGVTLFLKFIIFLIEPIFCLQYCLYISFATIIPLYLVYYIDRSAALIFCPLCPWLYKVLAKNLSNTAKCLQYGMSDILLVELFVKNLSYFCLTVWHNTIKAFVLNIQVFEITN